MERLTKKTENGSYAFEAAAEELASALGHYEDLLEGIEAERELVQLNLDALKADGKAKSATYTMLMGSRYMLDEMLSRASEPPEETFGRLENLRKLLKD